MKYLALMILLLPMFTMAQTGNLIIKFDELERSEGKIKVALFDSDNGFPDKGRLATRTRVATLKEAKEGITFPDLPYGEYAFTILHDENDNNQMDFNMFHYPKEGFGISNNPRIGLSAPDFEESSFQLNQPSLTMTVNMHY